MTENKLEGFEDFESILGDAGEKEKAGGGGLDDLLGGDAPAGGSAAESGDSELDSFFEDLSTIDDLEVLQEEESAPPPVNDFEETVSEAKAAPIAASSAAPAAKPAKAPAVASGSGIVSRFLGLISGFFGFLGKWLKRIIFVAILGVLAALGWFLYTTFFPDGKVPWEEIKPEIKVEDILKGVEDMKKAMPTVPEPPPPPAVKPKPKAKPKAPIAPRPVPGIYSLQVATCFFDSCVETFRQFLEKQNIGIKIQTRTTSSEALEVYTSTAFTTHAEAQDYADRINREHRMEGRAYVFQESGSFHISMGVFMELSKVNAVRDALNDRYTEDLRFTSRLQRMPYNLRSVLAGSYASTRDAEKDLRRLRSLDSRFKDAFIVDTRKRK